MAWTREDAGHLLRRAGFGGSWADVERMYGLGRTQAIAALVDHENVHDPVWAGINPLGIANATTDYDGNRANLLYQIAFGKRPLEAKLLWFWHGHFTTPFADAGPRLFQRQMATWRRYAYGSFGAFLSAMYKDGAMLRYLDGDANRKEKANENFSREVMELYTMGTGPFTETDVREAARALTGFTVAGADEAVSFVASRHDGGMKTILGQTAAFDGESFMQLLAARPETAKRVAGKLYRFFVSERLNLIELSRLISAWSSGKGNIKHVVRTLLNSSSFWDPRVRGTRVKDTLDYGLGLMQRLEVTWSEDRARELLWRFDQMGQRPFDPPNPAGYRVGLQLTGASMILARCQLAFQVIFRWAETAAIERLVAGITTPAQPGAVLDQVTVRIGSLPLGAGTRAAILGYLGTAPIARENLATRAREVAYLVACSPEYQVS